MRLLFVIAFLLVIGPLAPAQETGFLVGKTTDHEAERPTLPTRWVAIADSVHTFQSNEHGALVAELAAGTYVVSAAFMTTTERRYASCGVVEIRPSEQTTRRLQRGKTADAWPTCVAPPSPVEIVAGAIAGTVTDSTGEPLPGANVIIDGTERGAATNLDGEYVILSVLPGTYDLTASFVGFESRTQQVVVSLGTETNEDFVLESDGSLADLCVCCGYRPITSNDIYAPTVLTSEEIARLPVGW